MGHSQPYGGGRGSRQDAPAFQGPSPTVIKEIIVDGDVRRLVEWADKTGKTLMEQNLSTNQIRNVFGTVRQIQLRWGQAGSKTEKQAFRDAILLRPKLAYFAEREKRSKGGSGTRGMETLQTVLDPCLDLLAQGGPVSHERFQRFAEFFEAIVAYHKKYGGK